MQYYGKLNGPITRSLVSETAEAYKRIIIFCSHVYGSITGGVLISGGGANNLDFTVL